MALPAVLLVLPPVVCPVVLSVMLPVAVAVAVACLGPAPGISSLSSPKTWFPVYAKRSVLKNVVSRVRETPTFAGGSAEKKPGSQTKC